MTVCDKCGKKNTTVRTFQTLLKLDSDDANCTVYEMDLCGLCNNNLREKLRSTVDEFLSKKE